MMARRRFFVGEIRNGAAVVEGEDALHLTRVLRVETGQSFEISDNAQVWLAEVTEARKSLVEFRVIERIESGAPLAELHLYAALFKFDRFEWMVEKVTELGATQIVPVETERSDHGLFAAAAKRVERWRKIAREASQQSRRVRMPEVADPIKLRKLKVQGARLLLDELPGTAALQIPQERPVAVLLGPEGGWTEPERESLAGSGWVRSSLGPTVLRAETAGIAAMAILAHGIAAG